MVQSKNLMGLWKPVKKKIQNITTDKSEIEGDVKIDRCHRIRPHKANTRHDRIRSRTTVCKLNRFKEKQRILNNEKKLKNTGHLYL